jgi:DNA end-binding protein Ku
MAARAMWKGVIRFGDVDVPVKLFAAVQERTVRFNLLHKPDETPVAQQMVNPTTGDPVPRQEIRRGFQVDAGTFVVLDDAELEALEPKESRDITVSHFVPQDAIDGQWYDRPYWVGPDGDAETYAALAQALADEKRAGVAHWVMRKKAYDGVLRAEGPHLALVTLRHADEVISVDQLKPPTGRKLDAKEVRLAEQLVAALEDEWDPRKYHDEYRKRVEELIETKRKGGHVKIHIVEKKPTEKSLASALEKSLAAARKERARGAG